MAAPLMASKTPPFLLQSRVLTLCYGVHHPEPPPVVAHSSSGMSLASALNLPDSNSENMQNIRFWELDACHNLSPI